MSSPSTDPLHPLYISPKFQKNIDKEILKIQKYKKDFHDYCKSIKYSKSDMEYFKSIKPIGMNLNPNKIPKKSKKSKK